MIPLKDNIPNERFPFITVVLVVINVIAYLISIRHGGSVINGPSSETVVHNAAIPFDFTHPGDYCTVVEAGRDEFGNVVTQPECQHGAYIVLFPRARILSLVFIVFFVTIIEVPAVFLLGFWFLQQVYFGSANLTNPVGGGGGVAYFAHVGGFIFGLALIRLFVVRHK